MLVISSRHFITRPIP